MAKRKRDVPGPKNFRPITPMMTVRIDNRLKRARIEVSQDGVRYWAMPAIGYIGLMTRW